MCKKRHKRCFRVCGRVMSTKSIEYPNLTHDVSLAGGTNNALVRKNPSSAGERSWGDPSWVSPRPLEGKREPEKVQIWVGVGRRGRVREDLRAPANRTGGSIFTAPCLSLNAIGRDWCRHFSLCRHPFHCMDPITDGSGQKENFRRAGFGITGH